MAIIPLFTAFFAPCLISSALYCVKAGKDAELIDAVACGFMTSPFGFTVCSGMVDDLGHKKVLLSLAALSTVATICSYRAMINKSPALICAAVVLNSMQIGASVWMMSQ